MCPLHSLSGIAKTGSIDEQGIPNTISSDHAPHAPQLSANASAMISNAAFRFKHAEGSLGKSLATDSPSDTGGAKLLSALCISRTAFQVESSTAGKNLKCTLKNKNFSVKDTIDHIFGYFRQGADAKCVVIYYFYPTAYDTIELSGNIPPPFIIRY